MKRPSVQTLTILGVVIGLVAGMALAATFAPGDAGKATGGVAFGSPSGTNVTLYGATNVSMENVFPDNHSAQFDDRSVMLNTTQGGNITLASDNSTWSSVHTSNMTGTWTNVTEVTAGNNWLEIYPSDKQRVDTKGDVNELSVRSMALDDGAADFYISGTNGGSATVKIYDLPANTDIAARGVGGGGFLSSGTTDANGTLTLTIGLSSHTVELVTENPDAPVISNPSPTGQVSTSPDQVSVDVNDQDFASNADEVQVTFELKGNQIKQTNITSNGTVTANVSQTFDLGETVKWNVSAVDSYGLEDTSSNSFTMPENITLRNETNASQIIKNENITATFYSTNGTIVTQKSDSDGDGNISLKGLPDTDFVVTFDGEGWHDRRAYIESIGAQKNIYLLNSTAYPKSDDSAIQTTFVYEDRTGQFDQQNTTLEIERAVDPDGDGNHQWQVVAGDFWGAAGEFPFTGEYQQRYRLRITNQETGASRTLGTHIPTSDGVKNIIVGKIIFEAENATGRYVDARINQNTTNLQILYADPTNSTTGLHVVVHEQGNESNEIYNETFAGPFGEKVIVQSLTDNQTGNNYVVKYDVENTADGPKFYKVIVGGGEFPLPIDGDILSAFVYLFITFVMLLYGPRTALLGAWAGVFVFAGAAFFGWVSGVTVAVPVLIAIGATFYSQGSP